MAGIRAQLDQAERDHDRQRELIGLAGGLLPAVRAARLPVTEALRAG